MTRSFLPAALACLLLPALSPAAKVKVWHHHETEHYAKARFRHAVVSNEGALRLARQLEPFAKVEATHVWDVVEDRTGNLIVATGDEGKIFQVSPAGKVKVLYTGADSQVLCLAQAPDGTVYAGTGPGGTVICLPPQGKPRVLCKGLGSYVWSLVVGDGGQALYAGTGPKGRIFKVTPEGKATVFYTTRQDHVLCLARGERGRLYAGTDKGGLVYRIEPTGKGFVLYQAAQSEVRGLLVTPEGVYASTSVPTRRRGGSGGDSDHGGGDVTSLSKVPARTVSQVKGKPDAEKKTALSPSHSSDSSAEHKKTSTSSSPPPSSGENSLYCIRSDGTVRELFREKAMLLSLLRQGGRVFIGTGMDGQLFEVDEVSKERCEVARLDHGQIHRLLRRRDGSIVLATGDPGKLYVLKDKYCTRGTVVSEVLDAKMISKWGALRWKADTPRGTSVTVAVRSGNVAEPDETWSDWSEEQTDGRRAVAVAPPARYLQYRISLATEDLAVSPALQSVALRYLTANQAPEIQSVEVPDLDAVNLEHPKKIKIKWTATDPNEDDLTYNLYVRKEGWKSWVLLEENLEKREFEWDTTTTPSGIYQVKVVASDRKDNPAQDALTAAKTSRPFVVSHTPPAVTVKVSGMEGSRVILEATATDPLARLTSASFAVNGKKWVNVFPTDGLFDSKTEAFRFTTEALKPGTYVVVLKVRDAAGNTGSGDVVFTVKARQ